MITGKIGVFFMMQQKTLADVNGFVEEMVNGKKVIKVFCHEEKAKAELRKKNKAWEISASNANGFIRMLPQGYHTVLKGDGSDLSQGQRQLISIAPAAVSDPPS